MIKTSGRYEILDKIGQGALAVVYRAHDRQLDRQVALKELKPSLLDDPEAINQIRQEARTIARLEHPHIVAIHDVYETGDRLFIVMQLVDGAGLDHLLSDQGHLAWPETVEIITALAQGLDYAHSQGVLHRDLKPANILIDSRHGPMLSDFGLAKLVGQASTNLTAAGGIVGTPHYIAPEVWEGQGTSPQSDIYALGCVLGEMLTGQKIFPGDTPPTVMAAHFRPVELPEQWPAGVPAGINEILKRALARRPDDRYRSARELAQALADLRPTPPDGSASPQTPVLATKLFIPPLRPELVHRSRLVERLNHSWRRTSSVSLIAAPAGFGKTTLVSSWLHQPQDRSEQKTTTSASTPALSASGRAGTGVLQPFQCAWFSLDEADNDPKRFLTYLIASLQQVMPAIGKHLLEMLQAPQMPPVERIMVALINEFTHQARPGLVLVLDDYHLIESPAIHEAVSFLLDHLPPGLHLVLTSRVDPPLPLARLRARGQLIELRSQDLRFTAEETALFLNTMMGLRLSAQEIAMLETRTEGWIAGLQLAALSMQGRHDVSNFIATLTGGQRYILDYLVEEVLHRQPPARQYFLLATSILDQLTAPLCDAVTGQSGSQAILEALERANLFIIPLDEERRWYRYHHLFAEFLRNRLQQAPPDNGQELEPIALHRRAYDWYRGQAMLPEAIDHALAARDFEQAARLIETEAENLLKQGEIFTLQGWLEALPESQVRARPRLSLFAAWTRFLNFELDEVDQRLQDAEAALQTADTGSEIHTEVTGTIAAVRAMTASFRGDAAAARKYTRQALAYTSAQNTFLDSIAALSLSMVPTLTGDVVAASQAAAKAAKIGQQSDNLLITGVALSQQAELLAMQGQTHRAVQIYRQAIQLASSPAGEPYPVASMSYVGLGLVLYEWNEIEPAYQQVSRGIELSKQWGEITALDGYLALAKIKQAQGEPEAAAEAIAQAERLAQRTTSVELDNSLVTVHQVRLWLRQGRLNAAGRWAQSYQALKNEREGPTPFYMQELEEITLARVLIAQTKPAEAIALLAPLLPQAEELKQMSLVIEMLALLALANQLQGQTEQALDHLERALRLAQPGGYVRLFVAEGSMMGALLGRLSLRTGQKELQPYLGRLLAAFRAETSENSVQAAPVPFQPLIDPLTERELEVLSLIETGLANKEIAQTLVLSIGTVKKHLNNIYGKLGVHSRTQALAKAKELGLL